MAQSNAGSSAMSPQTLWSRRLKGYSADSPISLDDHVKTAWLLSYLSLLPLVRARELNTPLEAYMGPQAIKKLILDGKSPEDLAPDPRDEWAAMAQEIHQTIIFAEALTLGLSLLQIKAQITAAADDEALLQALKALIHILESKPPVDEVPLSPVDYSAVYTFAQQQIADGGLKNIPSWQKKLSGVQAKPWRQRVKCSLDLIHQRYERAVRGHPALVMPPDIGMIGAIPSGSLRPFIHKFDIVGLHLPSNDFARTVLSEAAVMNTCFDTKAFNKLMVDVRTDMADFVKKAGNDCFLKGNLQQSRKLYELMTLAGSNDPACSVNLAAVHLRIGKDRVNTAAAFNAAITGLLMISRVPPSGIDDRDNTRAFKARCEARAVRHAEWLETPSFLPPGNPMNHATPGDVGAAAATFSLSHENDDKKSKQYDGTRHFTCQEKHLNSLECKAWVRSARANAALAEILQGEIERDGASWQSASASNRAAQKQGDRAVLLKTALQAYQRALQAEPGNVDVRVEMERLELDIDNSIAAHRFASADLLRTMTLHGHGSLLSTRFAAAL